MSNLATDGFALLRADRVYTSRNSGGVGKGNKKRKGGKKKQQLEAEE